MNPPISDADVDTLVASILADGVVRFPRYALVAMEERAIDESDVRNVLRAGSCAGHRWKNGTYRYEVCTERFVVVIAFRSDEQLVIVTAWKEEPPS